MTTIELNIVGFRVTRTGPDFSRGTVPRTFTGTFTRSWLRGWRAVRNSAQRPASSSGPDHGQRCPAA